MAVHGLTRMTAEEARPTGASRENTWQKEWIEKSKDRNQRKFLKPDVSTKLNAVS